MPLHLERPDYTWFLRGASGDGALVNERRLTASFVIAPEALVEDWPVQDAATMVPDDLAPLLELAERAFAEGADLPGIRGYVEDSGEGRWTINEAINAARQPDHPPDVFLDAIGIDQ